MKHKISFTLGRVFIFIFFTACYTFLTFWIGTTIFLFFPFAILGLLFYVFIVLFHKGISKIADRDRKAHGNVVSIIAFAVAILFAVGYIFGVWWMQGLIIDNFGISSGAFKVVGILLELVSIGIGVFLSFWKKV